MSELKRTLAEAAFYPPHAPRTASALYTREHHELVVVQDQPCRVCGVRNSTLGDPLRNPHGAKALETHHSLIEWAGQTEIDWDKLAADNPTLPNLAAVARAYHAHLMSGGKPGDPIDPALVTQFEDSAEQLRVLCVAPDEPVLMADGTERRISAIRVGDQVIGGDARPHRVTGLSANEFDGELVVVDGVAMTAEHLVFSQHGWLPAGAFSVGQVIHEIRMLGQEMGTLAGVESQVAQPVVCPIPVDVVDALDGIEVTAEMLLHDPTVFHSSRPADARPDPDAGVALRRDLAGTAIVTFARRSVESRESTLVGAIAGPSKSGPEGLLTTPAQDRAWKHMEPFAPHDAALRRASGNGFEIARRDAISATADDAPENDPAVAVGVWRAVRSVEWRRYVGVVHDISIAGVRSFIVRGLTVHNCDVHHRAPFKGIHSITNPLFELQEYEAPGYSFVDPPEAKP